MRPFDNEPDNPGSDPDSDTESNATAPAAVERRLGTNIIVSIALFIIFAALFGTRRFAIGVSLGCALAYLNYRWLHGSLKAILTAAASGEAPPNAFQTISKFLLRWIVILAVVAVAIWQGGTQIVIGILVGLFAFPGAAIIEAALQIWWAVRGQQHDKPHDDLR